MMEAVFENRLIDALTRGLPRSGDQLNALHESDAELIRLPGCRQVLAVTADAVVEEIQLGLYADPYLIGWMTVTAAASDLAAVGAAPLGLLLIETLPPDLDAAALARLRQGIGDACAACGLAVLGGDTNTAASWQMAGVALGTVPGAALLTRRGAAPGQIVGATGPLGLGAAFAALRLQGAPVPFAFQPRARLEAGRLLRGRAACCIDTSDGGLAALDQLMRLNEVGFRLDGAASWIHPLAARMADRMGLPPWMMLAGLHGEFELVFCLPAAAWPELVRAAQRDGWTPLLLGTVIEQPHIELHEAGRTVQIDTARVRNLFTPAPPSIESLIEQLYACTQASE